MKQNFVLIHPEGLGMSPRDADALPEWERDWYLRELNDQNEKQQNNMPKGGGSSPSRPRFSK